MNVCLANKISQCHDHNEVGCANAAPVELLPTFEYLCQMNCSDVSSLNTRFDTLHT